MKSVIAVLTLGFALSMCHLTSKFTNTNTTSSKDNNSTSSSTPSTELQPPPPPPPGVSQNSYTKTIHAPISGGVLNGRAISLPPPAYPPIAKAAHASGTVTVQVVVDEDGKVISAHAVSGHPLYKPQP